jgi:hypothetical protein
MAGPTTTSSGSPAITDSQGSTVTFNAVTFKATKVSVVFGGGSSASSGSSQIDVSHLGLASGSNKEYQTPPLNEVTSGGGTGVIATVSIDFLDLQRPELNAEHDIDLGAKLKIKGKAKCTEYQLDAQVNDVLRGSAKFDLTVLSSTYP